MATPAASSTCPVGGTGRTLGFWSATALIIASMMGTGVFTTSGFLMADLKSPWLVLAAWLVSGVVATLGALSYGALARHIPESGGEYLFLSRTLHPAAGCMAGWVSVLVGFSAPLAAAANAFGEYTKDWLHGISPPVTGTLLLMVLSAIHGWNVKRGAAAQNLAVSIKVLLIMALIGLGITRIPDAALVGSSPTFSAPGFAMSLVWVSFSYAGWNAAIYLGGEIRDPERNLPRSLLTGTVLVTLLYLAVNAVFVLAVPAEKIAGRLEIGRIAASHLGGSIWAEISTVLIVIALATSASSFVMAGPRVYAKMAADGYLPRRLAQFEGPPRQAILFQFLVALLMLWTASYQNLLTFIGFTLNLSTAATVIGLFLLRRRLGEALQVPGWPWVPSVFVVAILGMTGLSVARAPLPSLAGCAVLGLGWCAWRFKPRGASPV